MDLVIEGRYYRQGELRQGCIGIEDGHIVEIGRILKGDEHLDMGSKIIIPAAVDPHVHFRDPGMTEKEDFVTGSLAALHAGVGCVLDMPNTRPPVTDLESLDEKRRRAKGRSFVDYGLFAALTKKCNISSLSSKVCGFKLFMGSTTGNILLNDDHDIARLMPSLQASGKVLSVHSEDDTMIDGSQSRDTMGHNRSRSYECEMNAIRRLAPYKGMKINICHATSPAAVDAALSLGFSTEVTAHHLLLNAEDGLGTRGKVNPPLRDKDVQLALWDRFQKGGLILGSDHAPHMISDKEQEFPYAPSGMPGVETAVPMLMAMVKRGTLPISLLVESACEAPSRRFGLNKGIIAPGYDADIAVFDPRSLKGIQGKELRSKAGWTPFEGREAIFVDTLMLRGELQFSRGELCGEPIGRDVSVI